VFFAWSREKRSDGGLGWLEAARRTNFATVVGAPHKDQASPGRGVPRPAGSADDSVDDDEHLAAYNAYLARLNQQDDH
jgi:hypothetical protein